MATLEIGDTAADFDGLLGVDGQSYSLSSFDGKQVLVIIFSCNGCPTVKAAEDRLMAIQDAYASARCSADRHQLEQLVPLAGRHLSRDGETGS